MAATNKPAKPHNILVMRFSAVGDVAMTVPVLYSLAYSYPGCRITFLSNARFEPMFRTMPDNFRFLGVDLKHDYNGTSGLNRLYKELVTSTPGFDMVADLHGVLRTKYLSVRFILAGYRVRSIRKERIARNRLTKPGHNGLKPLKSAFDRYLDVFRRLKLDFDLHFDSIHPERRATADDLGALKSVAGTKGDEKWIGIAPFAAFEGKMYPIGLMEQVVSRLNEVGNCKLFVFAYGKEQERIADWNRRYKSFRLIGGRLTMWQELLLMNQMDIMLAMDSANMHLASLVGLPVISIWGATHPAAGFLGYGQAEDNCIQADMPCRPCSIYGKKPCQFGDYRCMHAITPDSILKKINSSFACETWLS